MGHETSTALKWSLRCLAAASFFIGLGYIIWALVLQNPPKTSLPVGLVILGSFALAVSLLGFFHSFCGRGCLSVFLFVTFLVTVGELAVVISLFANLDSAVNTLVQHDAQSAANSKSSSKSGRRLFATPAAAAVSNDQDKYRTSLEIGRYVFLVAVLIEFIILLVTIVLRVRHPYKESEGDFEEQRAARSAMAQIQMESLKNSTQRGNGKSPGPGQDSNFYTGSAKLYKSVTKKMSQKYGEFTADPAFQKKWWQSLPGFR